MVYKPPQGELSMILLLKNNENKNH